MSNSAPLRQKAFQVPKTKPPVAIAYSISDPSLPYKRNSWYRFERLGLLKLTRNGGKTFVRGEDVEGVVSGRIKIADHPARKHRPEPKAAR
jgi:hypothetical protein